jgi:type II secretory pathway pseudopilin PulG
MLVVIGILGILMAAGYPTFTRTLKTVRIRSGAREMCSAFRVTRSYAIAIGKEYDTIIKFQENIIEVYETPDFKAPHKMPDGIDLRDGNGNTNATDLVVGFQPRGSSDGCTVKVYDGFGADDDFIALTVYGANGRAKVYPINVEP